MDGAQQVPGGDPDAEQVLAGGNASGHAVVRVGTTVRKPWTPNAPRVAAHLEALLAAGIDVPRPLGRDAQGRQVLEFVPGTMAIDRAPLPDDLVGRVGRLVRRLHDASAALPLDGIWEPPLMPAPRAELVCHNDLATWNLVMDGERLVFIDWDAAGPSSRAWDLAYAAISFAHLFLGTDVGEGCRRLTALADGYGADAALRAELPALMADRARAMHALLRVSHETGREPWASMYVDFHGEHWRNTTRFVERHHDRWAAALLPGPSHP